MAKIKKQKAKAKDVKSDVKISVKPTAKKQPQGRRKIKLSAAQARPGSKPSMKSNLKSKIRDLAAQTQKTVQGQLATQTEALRTKLSAYGIGVDDVKATAKHLEQVLKDLRGRDFLKQPGIQSLVERVTKKNIERANHEAQKMAERIPRKKMNSKQKQKQDKLFGAFSERTSQHLGGTVVQAIIKRVEEVRKSLTGSAQGIRRKK